MAEWARVVTVQGSPDRVDQSVGYIRDTVVPRASSLPGFRRGFWLMDRETGSGTVVTIYADRASLDASAATAEQLRAGSASALGVEFTGVASYEVVAEAGPPA